MMTEMTKAVARAIAKTAAKRRVERIAEARITLAEAAIFGAGEEAERLLAEEAEKQAEFAGGER